MDVKIDNALAASPSFVIVPVTLITFNWREKKFALEHLSV
tara:strand:+ start:402 stop:521 length:120 start_codon:yes stop_codon:yes gene_type:complete